MTEDEQNYIDLLKRAREGLPKEVLETSRFTPPRFESFVQGPQTIIKNFTDVAKALSREAEHLSKYISAESGTSGVISGTRLEFKGQKSTEFLNGKLDAYIHEFVLCKQCKKPDTEIRKEKHIPIIKCRACGAKYTIRKL